MTSTTTPPEAGHETSDETAPAADARRRWPRVLAGVLLVPLGVLLGPVAAAAAFLGAATVTDRLPPLYAAALAALLLGCGLPVHAAVRRRHVTVTVTGLVALATVLLAAATVLRPLDVAAPRPRFEPTGYWELPTGSRLAHHHLPAVGPPRPTPVIVLHGGPGTPGDGPSDVDRALASRGYDVYTYDQVGSGRSTRLSDPTGYTVARQVADLEAIRVELGADRVVLLGSSWGASLAAEYLAAHPDRVAAMVLTSPGTLWAPAWADRGEGDIWDRLTPEQERRIAELENNPRLVAWSLLTGVNPRAAHALVPDAEIDPLFAELLDIAAPAAACDPTRPLTVTSAALPGFYANQLVSADQSTVPDPRPALRSSHVPTLVLRGDCDYKRPEIAAEYAEVLPEARLVTIPDAGHVIESDQPDAYREAILDFLTPRQ